MCFSRLSVASASRWGTPPVSARLAAAPSGPNGALNSFWYSKCVALPLSISVSRSTIIAVERAGPRPSHFAYHGGSSSVSVHCTSKLTPRRFRRWCISYPRRTAPLECPLMARWIVTHWSVLSGFITNSHTFCGGHAMSMLVRTRPIGGADPSGLPRPQRLAGGLPLAQRALHRGIEAVQAHVHELRRAVVAREQVALEPVHERADQLERLARDRRRDARGQRRGRQGQAHGGAGEQQVLGDALDHLAVGEDIGPRDVERPAAGAPGGRGGDEVGEHVAPVDRPGAEVPPARGGESRG